MDTSGPVRPGHGAEDGAGGRGLWREFAYDLLVPHSHDAAERVDDVLEASAQGIRAVKVSMVMLLVVTGMQAVIVAISGSVALMTDTIHHAADILTAVPLWIAFVLSRRPPTRRFTYGLARAEDLAGLVIVLVIASTAITAAVESIGRFLKPEQLVHLELVAVAGVVGFVGNELVARYRLRVGRRIGSAALIADGVHARTDGFISLAIVLSAAAVALGFPWADAIIGLGMAGMIVTMAVRTGAAVGRRLLDGVAPQLVQELVEQLDQVPEVSGVHDLCIRAVGHSYRMEVTLDLPGDLSLADVELVRGRAEEVIRARVPRLQLLTIACRPEQEAG